MSPLDSFQALQRAARQAPLPSLQGGQIHLLTDTTPQYLSQAIQAEALRQNLKIDLASCQNDRINALLLQPSPLNTSGLTVVYPAAEVILESFQQSSLADRPNFALSLCQEWQAARRSYTQQHPSSQFLWFTPAPLINGFGGYLDAKIAEQFNHQLHLIQSTLRTHAQTEPNLNLFDLHSLIAQQGYLHAHDNRLWSHARIPLALDFLPSLAFHLIKAFRLTHGQSPKVIVTDLDNTLWGGVLADESIDHIQLAPHDQGLPFYQLQQWLNNARLQGLLLAICSKNDPSAIQALSDHPHMILRPDAFAATQINWNPKSENIRAIAADLNLSLDSFIFLDDQPFERTEVRTRCPEVTVPDLPEDPAERLPCLKQLQLFPQINPTSREDQSRAVAYAQEKARAQSINSFTDYPEYLRSLQMVASVDPLSPANLNRVFQLSQRSNQFNLRTRRYELPFLQSQIENPDSLWLTFSLRDRFGDYGLIAVVEIHLHDDLSASIENWFMSCRVLQRMVELFTLDQIIEHLKPLGVSRLIGSYQPTPKNTLVQNLYPQLGFTEISPPHSYQLQLSDYSPPLDLPIHLK